jgi:hypothetical protein
MIIRANGQLGIYWMSMSSTVVPPSLYDFLDGEFGFRLPWMMSYGERLVLFSILQHAKPDAAIEIGTAMGGSLQVIARFARRVYSLDQTHDQLEPVDSHVELRTGDSKEHLPLLLRELDQRDEKLGFVLIDGAHDEPGTCADINNLLSYIPKVPLYVLMHDSFNPSVRKAIRAANWTNNRHVHYVELDFIHGAAITHVPQFEHQMWGGFALAMLLPKPRKHVLQIQALMEYTYSSIFEIHARNRPELSGGWAQRLRRKLSRTRPPVGSGRGC